MKDQTTTTGAERTASSAGMTRYFVIAVLVLGAFFGAYRFAVARTSGANGAQAAIASSPGTGLQQASGTASNGAADAACACCGSTAPTANGLTGEKVEGAATAQGDVQTISVDVSKGYYEPNQIVLKAGVPAEITFSQSSGCTAQVVSQDLGFAEDLTAGPRTVSLPALEPGEYAFSCGMQMVFGKIVVE